MKKLWTTLLDDLEQTVMRCGDESQVVAGKGFNSPGEVLCHLENTGNGYIACFPAYGCMEQDYYVCLDYAQAYDLVLALSAFKKELGFEE